MFKFLRIIILLCLGLLQYAQSYAQYTLQDTLKIQKQQQFYNSLEHKANQKKFTEWIYNRLISPPRPYVDKKALALDYFSPYEGKVIASIKIKSLDVFGPSLVDTTQQAQKWIERSANTIHTKSNLKTIEKQLLFQIGDLLNPELMYENERLIRNLSYIKDTRILIEQDSTYAGFVNILVLTQDRFSFGVSGGVNGTSSGDIKLYDRNIFGVGHEVSVKFVGHVNKEPYMGVESFYSINNVAGKFLDIDLGYLNTYRTEGYIFKADKPFYTQTTKWGYGTSWYRMFRTFRISSNDPVEVDDPLNMSYNNIWGGRSFNISPKQNNYTQFVFSSSISNWNYFEAPIVSEENEHFFANHTLYLAGLTLSQRRFIQDQLIYSYGITEDIPEGFKTEIIYGYDANEYGDRHYIHFFTSNGNLLMSRRGYLYCSAGIGGYFNDKHFEEGQVQTQMRFISKIKTAGAKRVRTFIDMSYTLGIRRYDIENLTLGRNELIRGFDSDIAVGKQRLSLKFEHIVFLPRQFYNFNLALFGFADLGIIGSNHKFILNQKYYSGIGCGLRLHNENLVFETLRLRLAYYPFHPGDMRLIGFSLNEQSKQEFNTFEPVAPTPLSFE